MKPLTQYMITVLMVKTIPTSNSITTAMLINCLSTRLMETRSSLARITRLVESKRAWQEKKKRPLVSTKLIIVEPRSNEPLSNEDLGMTISFTPVIVKYMKKNLDITKPLYSEQILPVAYIEVPL